MSVVALQLNRWLASAFEIAAFVVSPADWSAMAIALPRWAIASWNAERRKA